MRPPRSFTFSSATIRVDGRELRGITAISFEEDPPHLRAPIRLPSLRVTGEVRGKPSAMHYLAIGALVGADAGAARSADSILEEVAAHGVRPCFHDGCTLFPDSGVRLCRHTFPAKHQETPTR